MANKAMSYHDLQDMNARDYNARIRNSAGPDKEIESVTYRKGADGEHSVTVGYVDPRDQDSIAYSGKHGGEALEKFAEAAGLKEHLSKFPKESGPKDPKDVRPYPPSRKDKDSYDEDTPIE